MQPRALADGIRLRVVSLAAGRHGVRAGMSIPEARAMCAALDIRPWNASAIDDAILATTAALLSASPQVTPVAGAPGMWWIGATGFGALGGEQALGRALLDIARRWHPEARVAIADSCVAARAATWAPLRRSRAVRECDPLSVPEGVICIPTGGCARYLAPAPLGLIPMHDELRDALLGLGLRTIGALAALDAGDVEQRWGNEGLTAWRLARGDDTRRPGLVRVEAARVASAELPSPVESTAPVLFVLRALLERLVRELVADARAAAAVAITLVLDAGRQWPLDGDSTMSGAAPVLLPPDARTGDAFAEALLAVPHRTITRETRPARPLARLEPLFDQCRALLERWTIPAPIIGVAVSIPATAPLAADQGDLLVPSWRDAAMNAEAVFTRLRLALDPEGADDVVVHPVEGDAHRPEEAGRWEHADAYALAASTPSVASEPASAPATLDAPDAVATVFRMLDRPETVDVEEAGGVPDAVWWRGRRLAFTTVDGPERLSGDWWRSDAFARDYWRGMVAGEGELLLYREARSAKQTTWYVHGWYD